MSIIPLSIFMVLIAKTSVGTQAWMFPPGIKVFERSLPPAISELIPQPTNDFLQTEGSLTAIKGTPGTRIHFYKISSVLRISSPAISDSAK